MQPEAIPAELMAAADAAAAAYQAATASSDACRAAIDAHNAATDALRQAAADLHTAVTAAGLQTDGFQHAGHVFTAAAGTFAIAPAPPRLEDLEVTP